MRNPYRPLPPSSGFPTYEDQEDDPRALWNAVHVGDPQGWASPSEDLAMKRLLGEHYDERVRREREDEDPSARMNSTFGRMQADAANGPGGYARQWTPFFEALRGSKVKMGGPDGLVTGLERAASGPVEMPTVEMPTVHMPSVDVPTVAMDSLLEKPIRPVASHRPAPAKGNVDLYKQPKVKNPDGTTSTVDSRSYNLDGQEVLLPSVTPDGRHFQSDDDIVNEYQNTGRHLGKFPDVASANAAAARLHEDYAAGKYDVKPVASHGPTPDYYASLSSLMRGR